MTDDTQPEALRLANVCSNLTRYSMDAHLIAAELRRQHTRIADLEAQLEAVGAGGVSGPLVGRAALSANAGEPMASATKDAIMGAAYDFRDAHISGSMNLKRSAHAILEAAVDNALAAQAAPQQEAQEPCGWMTFTEEGDPDMVFLDRLEACQYCEDDDPPKPLYLVAPPAAQAEGWQSIETAPKEGVFLVYMQDEVRPARRMQVANWHPNVKIVGGLFAFDCAKGTHWMPLPHPPTSAEGVEHG